MQDYENIENDHDDAEEDQQPHFFCKLTFGQFFTLMVLEIVTLSFVFYLGARYGNEYLKLDVITEARREPVSIVSKQPHIQAETAEAAKSAKPDDLSDDELREMARKAMGGEKVDLRQRVEEILARQQGPSTPPVGEPSFEDQHFPEGQPAAQTTGPQEMRPYKPAPETPSTQEVVRVKSAESAKFSVQVGSYPDVKEASYRVEEWKVKGYPAYMMIANLGDKGQWYRVRIGAFADKGDAEKYLSNLVEREEIADAFVVKNEQ